MALKTASLYCIVVKIRTGSSSSSYLFPVKFIRFEKLPTFWRCEVFSTIQIYILNQTKSSLVTDVTRSLVLTVCLHSERAQTANERQRNSMCLLFIGKWKRRNTSWNGGIEGE